MPELGRALVTKAAKEFSVVAKTSRWDVISSAQTEDTNDMHRFLFLKIIRIKKKVEFCFFVLVLLGSFLFTQP